MPKLVRFRVPFAGNLRWGVRGAKTDGSQHATILRIWGEAMLRPYMFVLNRGIARYWGVLALAFCLVFSIFAPNSGAQSTATATAAAQPGLAPIRQYIADGWDTLTRSLDECKSIVDTKLTTASVLYMPADFDVPAAVQRLQAQCNVEAKHLPSVIHNLGEIDESKIDPAGLLYLPHKYVVPGGRFNEMYGWDSYFIIRGLVRDKRIELAQGMVENFFFEIEHYGAILNANRTYYLTRSQPPFLTSMILDVYDAKKAAGQEDRAWLEKAYGYAVRDHNLWTREPHLASSTGLSRYFDFGTGPAPESLKDETGHLAQVAAYFLAHPDLGREYLIPRKSGSEAKGYVGPLFAMQVCESTVSTMSKSDCASAGGVSLSADYYKGDRSMRESGYDIAFRFGPYGVATHHYAPVCLNSLLYKAEEDLARMADMLGKKKEAAEWHERAKKRKEAINKYLWNAKRGMFFDYDFTKNEQSTYEYVTTFLPLWTGLATKEQAAAVVKNVGIFERPGGLMMSPYETGGQWDAPYAWAPNQLMADDGIRKYGFIEVADRVSYAFLSNVLENFRRDGTIREKYNAVTRSSETAVTAGYKVNIVGFGWTNGVFLVLSHELPEGVVEKLGKE
jgi:alpha,alpha-trehalase